MAKCGCNDNAWRVMTGQGGRCRGQETEDMALRRTGAGVVRAWGRANRHC